MPINYRPNGRSFLYKGYRYRDGDAISGTIEGRAVTGHLRILANHCFFCQDHREGTETLERLGHKYSWIFAQLSANCLSDNVELDPPEPAFSNPLLPDREEEARLFKTK